MSNLHSELGCAPRTNAPDKRYRLVEDLQRVSAGGSGRYVRYGVDNGRLHLFDVPGMSQATILTPDALNEVYSGLVDPESLPLFTEIELGIVKLDLYRGY